MTHPDEGTLRAWLDGELSHAEAREIARHVEEDPRTSPILAELRERESRVRTLLATLDVEAPTERVRRVLRAARAATTDSRAVPSGGGRGAARPLRPWGASARWARRSRLAQAAALVLLLAGAAAAAIPGSPVRSWLSEALGSRPEPAGVAVEPAGVLEPQDRGGLVVTPGSSRVEVELIGVPDGVEIQVTLVDEDTALVLGPEGSSYEWDAEAGRATAVVTAGPIRLELPEAVDTDLIVDGRVYMSRRDGRMDVQVTPSYQTGAEIRFRSGY